MSRDQEIEHLELDVADVSRIAVSSAAIHGAGAASRSGAGFLEGPTVVSITRVSTAGDGTQGKGASYGPAFSSDGAQVGFSSQASNLVPGDTNGVGDIFIKDLATRVVTLVSTDAKGVQGNRGSEGAVFSHNGMKLAFISGATNLSPSGGSYDNIFVKDPVSGEVTRVSAPADGTAANRWSESPAFSPDGARVAFRSNASNLVPGDTAGLGDIFVKDLGSGAIMRVSTAADGTQGLGGSSIDPVFSPDGTRVAFASFASNLVPGDTNRAPDIFLKDLATGAVTRISTSADGAQANGGSYRPVFSPDGSQLAFASDASNLAPGDSNRFRDIFVKNLVTGETILVSTSADQSQGNGASYDPEFSPDGTKVAFVSSASNLVIRDTNGLNDIFIKNIVNAAIANVSRGPNGAQANGASYDPTFSPDGAKLAFGSDATNLVPKDTNGAADIFVVGLADAAAPSAAIGLGRTEVESLDIGANFVVEARDMASQGEVLKATSFASEASAFGAFDGPVGVYSITVGYVDEDDGVCEMELRVNGVVIDSWRLDRVFDPADSRSSYIDEQVAANVELAPGDVIELAGRRDGGEFLRADYVEVATQLGLGRTEAETFAVDSNYIVDTHPRASGGAVLRAENLYGSDASKVFGGPAGTYDITIGYLDEKDGDSTFALHVNGVAIDSWVWDRGPHSKIIGPGGEAEHVIGGVTLAPGDVIEFVGSRHAGELLRTDYIEIDEADGSGPGTQSLLDVFNADSSSGLPYLATTPGHYVADPADALPLGNDVGRFYEYVRFGDIDGDRKIDAIIANSSGLSIWLNDFVDDDGVSEGSGSGRFEPGQVLPFGNLSRASLALGDMDGDNDPDIVLAQGSNVTVLLNDGRGAFSEHASLVASTLLPLNIYSLGDVDGDGDRDIVSSVTLLNDGTGRLTEAASLVPNITRRVQLTDLDRDGVADIVYHTSEVIGVDLGDNVTQVVAAARLGAGDGTFAETIKILSSTKSYLRDELYQMPLADFDGDGDIDVGLEVGIDSGGDPLGTAYRFDIFEFDGENDSFKRLTSIPGDKLQQPGSESRAFSWRPAIGDADNDNDMDLLLPYGRDGKGAQLFLNDGGGNFKLIADYFDPPLGPSYAIDAGNYFAPVFLHLDSLVEPYAVSDPSGSIWIDHLPSVSLLD